ncbi:MULTISPECIES: hypothetical protein [unclassified Methylobacterium]|nr:MULTISPECIES: hypothetical protein [unclassified Methylobacterium]MCJ2102274.1 hypothetical protein [Methylobacterium sp. E-046]TXM95231.1 hypothetical protein FV223_01665 [Methylobacterium sp. WL116]
MPSTARTMRRNRLFDDITLLAIVIPAAKRAPDRRYSEHRLGDGMLITRRVDGEGRRVVRLLVQGTPVLMLFEGECGNAIGFARDGHWNLIVKELVRPWGDFLCEIETPGLSPARRVHSTRSPYAARGRSHTRTMSGPEIVLFVARYVASLGDEDPVDGNVMDFVNESEGFHLKIVRTAQDIILLADGTGRTQLVGVLRRHDLDRPAEIRHRLASPWLTETMIFLRADAESIDPADLVAFARAGT